MRIFPGNTTIQQGETINFSAVGYDGRNEPLVGIGFSYFATDIGRNLSPRRLSAGKFQARLTGTFRIVAVSQGVESAAIITVLASAAGNPQQTNAVSSPPISIGTRNKTKSNSKEKDQGSSENTNSLIGDGNWNADNWPSSDNPGNQPGNPAGSPMDGGAGSGNFQMSAPVLSLPGRGIDLALNLSYNSRLWNKSGSEITYDIDRGWPAPGWSLGFGKIMDMSANGGSMLIDADGTRHGYTGLIFPYGGFSVFRGFTTDGKFIDYESHRDNNGIYYAKALMPNGTQIIYGAKGDNAVHPTNIRDANGNFITITYRNNIGPAIETITDTAGRVVTFEYDSNNRLISARAPKMQDEPGFPGGKTRELFKLHYKQIALNYSFAGGNTPVVREGSPWVIDAIYYPATNTGYWFNDTDSYSTYGMITKVVEQRGMSWATGPQEQGTISGGTMTKEAEYNYPLTAANVSGRTNGIDLSDAPTYTSLTERWDGRDVAEDAITTYSIDENGYGWNGYQSVPARITTVTQPNGTINKQYASREAGAWYEGLVFADETFVPNGQSLTLVSSSLVHWQQGDYVSPRPWWAEITDERGHKVKTVYEYSNNLFNQITRSCDYDNAGVLLRCTNATYENSGSYKGYWQSINTGNGTAWYFAYGRHIFSLPLTTTIENPDGSIASRTVYEYDNYTAQPFTNAPGVIQHDVTHDYFTTQTIEGPNCVHWECGEINCGNTQPPDPAWYCALYEQISAYDSATDKRGNVTKVTSYADAQNQTGAIVETSGFDITGNLVEASSSCCEQTSIQYGIGTQFAYPVSQTRGSSDVTSPHRITVSAVYDDKTGLLKQSTDANGRTSTINYNPDTLRPVKTTSSTGAYSTTTYDEAAMKITDEAFEANGTVAGKSVKHLNGLGLTIKEESFAPNGIVDIVETKYTKFAEEWKHSRPYRSGDTVQWSEKFYDAQRRLIKIVEPDGSETKAFYNESTIPDSVTSLPGNRIRVMDAWGRERWGRYDQQQRLVEVVEPNPNGNGDVFATGSLVTKYSYDTLNRLIQTDQGGQLRKFKYDDLGRMTRQKLAEQTATLNDAGQFVGAGNGSANWAEAFIYDNRSNLTQKTDARGVRTNVSYQLSGGGDDPLNRVQSRSYDTSGPLEPGLVIHAASAVTYQYMASGDKSRISQIRTDGVLTEDYSYDGEGRVSHYAQVVDYRADYEMKTSYLYDTLDRVKEVTYPAQYGPNGGVRKIVANTYDTASRLTSLTYGGALQASGIVYNASDQTTQMLVGANGANQVNEQYTFDQQTGLLTNQKAIKGAATLLDLTYDYNRNNSNGSLNGKTGHLTKIIDNLNNAKNREYEFDAVGRLTKAKGGVNGALWNQQYSYDRYGNRTSVAATGVAADNSPMPVDGIPNLAFNTANNRITTDGFQYDSAGNQTRALGEDGIWLKYEYDAANRLRVVKQDDGSPNGVGKQAFMYGSSNARLIDYDYNVGLNKLFASVGGTTLNEYTEYAGAIPTWTKSYTYLGDSQLSTITPNGTNGETVEFNHPDRLGTKLTTNPQSGAVSEQTTLPFGKNLTAESGVVGQTGTTSGTGASTKKFTTYDRSSATGLDYAVNRTYDSKQGRFTQVDPIGMEAVDLSNPQTLNLYTYCGNDPVNHVDPDGLFFKKLFKWIGKHLKKILAVVAVVLAIVALIAFPWSGPITAKAILGLVGALSGGASSIFELAGLKTLSKVFGFIAMAAGIAALGFEVKNAWQKLKKLKSKAFNFADDTRKIGEFFVEVRDLTDWEQIVNTVSSISNQLSAAIGLANVTSTSAARSQGASSPCIYGAVKGFVKAKFEASVVLKTGTGIFTGGLLLGRFLKGHVGKIPRGTTVPGSKGILFGSSIRDMATPGGIMIFGGVGMKEGIRMDMKAYEGLGKSLRRCL